MSFDVKPIIVLLKAPLVEKMFKITDYVNWNFFQDYL